LTFDHRLVGCFVVAQNFTQNVVKL